MPKRVRVRHAGGSATIGVPPGATAGEVAGLIESVAPSLSPASQAWRAGYPPRPMAPLRDTDPFPPEVDMLHASEAGPGLSPAIEFRYGDGPTEEDLGKEYAAAMAAAYCDLDADEPPMTDSEGYVVRRVIDSDNSCLFNAVGYCLKRSRSDAALLRRMAARAVRDDPDTFTEAFLGQSPEDYVAFLMRSDSWGGQIELHIFSQLFRAEIAAFDVVRDRDDVYGTGRGYRRRAFVIYDGVHYDALAFAFDPSLPEEADATLFSPRDGGAMAKARALCAQQHRRKQFTDTGSFALRCAVCQEGLKGAAEAQEHAKVTRHTNFVEYS